MNILIAGSGGREHALAWKIKQSVHCSQLYIAPGNAGTATVGTNIPLSVTDFEGLGIFCLQNNIELLVVGPEEPLVKGIYDYFTGNPTTAHIHIIGPSKAAAQLEGSKAFAKAFMQKYKIPTAAYGEFTLDNYKDGVDYINKHDLPVVLKADGLAAGKGVVICENYIEALAEFELMIQRAKFGDAGKRVVIEEFLQGIELSIFVLTFLPDIRKAVKNQDPLCESLYLAPAVVNMRLHGKFLKAHFAKNFLFLLVMPALLNAELTLILV